MRREIGLAGQFAAVEPTLTGRENLEMVAHLFGHRRKAAAMAAKTVIECSVSKRLPIDGA